MITRPRLQPWCYWGASSTTRRFAVSWMSGSCFIRPERNAPRPCVMYRRVNPTEPLTVIEMDFKFQWVLTHQLYAYILTIIDCFTPKPWIGKWRIRSLKTGNICLAGGYHRLFTAILNARQKLTIEVRNDNNSRLAAKEVQAHTTENHLNQFFTHPFTFVENSHIKSFHAIFCKSLSR